ncbi:MAG: adenosylcobinamide-GDP ribazoletransferase [Treponema sp.]|jgi:adenosylcobinamide-GDP ribazoletransferase|nr:adenosylcobinamide-GDP ribazoletransferase [Treponema sp.]
MKRYLKGFYMSLGMFSAIPLPFHLWDQNCVNLVIPCLPLIGGLIGALWWGIAKLLILSGIHIMPAAAVLTLVPFLASGFLHLDGYMDTSDAVLSHRPLVDKLRILKDPHTGSFAVIMLAVLFVLQFTLVYTVIENEKNIFLLIIIPILSRCCASFSVLSLKPLTQSAYASMFRQNTGTAHKVFIIIIAILTLALAYYFADILSLIVAASVIAGFTVALVWAYRNLKGISGDLAGFGLVIAELGGLAALALI